MTGVQTCALPISKTGVGVEESGTGREVSRTQKDDFTENAVMPQVENIIDALNLDYRRSYTDEYKKTKYNIALDNPLETDRDAERADVEIRREQFALMQEALNAGYSYEVASKYARGVLNITDLGMPKEETPEEPETAEETPEETPEEPEEESEDGESEKTENKINKQEEKLDMTPEQIQDYSDRKSVV